MLPLRDTDPREVGGYQLLGRLGEGGQGVVFLALGPTGSRAAVKLLAPTTDPLVRSRFLKEVAAAQQVAGFCTAQVLDAGIFERRPFIVSEYVSGPSLVEVVQQHGPRTGAVLERIAVATLTALGAVHAVGMVHRDFKPGNVLLGPDGPVVIDFGLAAVPGMTTTGLSGQVAVGTPAFMAPEQLAGVRVTPAADMWSWAVTIAFTGTGELPFRGESLTATAYAILHSEPIVGPLTEPLGSLVYRCLSKDQATRPSARSALGELAAAGARLVSPLPPIAPALPGEEKTPCPPRAPATVPESGHGNDDGLNGARPTATHQPASTEQRSAAGQPAGTEERAAAGKPAAAEERAAAARRAATEPHAGAEQPAASQRPERPGSRRVWWRRWPAAVLASILVAAGVAGAALVLSQHGASPGQPTGGNAGAGQQSGTGQQSGAGQQIPAAAAARALAVNWIVHQVSHATVVGCDPQVCTDLTKHGFPAGDVSLLGPQSNDPSCCGLVVVTPAVQAQFGKRLASVFAPAIIASFGSGQARIDIRLVFAGGTTGYRDVQQTYQRDRKTADRQLLTNSGIKLSAAARRQLLSGEVDPRLPMLIATMVQKHPVRIVDFGGWSPGGGPASLLRWMDVARVNRGAHLTPAAYLSWVQSFMHKQRAQFRHARSGQVTLATGQTVVRIEYLAPSPLSQP
jgi:hypothetical protein